MVRRSMTAYPSVCPSHYLVSPLGIAVPLFGLTFRILVRNGKARRRFNRPLFIAAVVLLILATSEFMLNVLRLHRAFISIGPHLTGGPEGYFLDVTRVSWIVKGALYGAQTLIMDAILVSCYL